VSAQILRKSVGLEWDNCCVFRAGLHFCEKEMNGMMAAKTADLLAFLQILPEWAER
jgi:hypothetical protein